MAATKKNHIPPHIQKYFNTYGYNKLVPLNTYFQNQTKRITMQNQLKRLENMQYAIQSTINTLPNSNNKKRYISNLTTLQELPNAKKQENALLQLKKAILLKQEQKPEINGHLVLQHLKSLILQLDPGWQEEINAYLHAQNKTNIHAYIRTLHELIPIVEHKLKEQEQGIIYIGNRPAGGYHKRRTRKRRTQKK